MFINTSRVWEAGHIPGTVRLVIVTSFTPHYADMASTLSTAKGMASVTALYKPVDLAKLRAALA